MCQTASERALNWIENYIKQNQLSVGDHLPGELEISASAKTGRSSVREALTAMKVLGIIQSKTSSGITIVRDPVLLEMRHYFTDKYEKSEYIKNKRYEDAREFRAIMDWGIGSFAFSRIKPKTIKALKKLLMEAEQGEGSEAEITRLDIEFHRILTTGFNNRLAELFTHIYELIFAGPRSQGTNYLPEWVKTHTRLLDALESGDEPRFLEELRKHTQGYLRKKIPSKSHT